MLNAPWTLLWYGREPRDGRWHWTTQRCTTLRSANGSEANGNSCPTLKKDLLSTRPNAFEPFTWKNTRITNTDRGESPRTWSKKTGITLTWRTIWVTMTRWKQTRWARRGRLSPLLLGCFSVITCPPIPIRFSTWTPKCRNYPLHLSRITQCSGIPEDSPRFPGFWPVRRTRTRPRVTRATWCPITAWAGRVLDLLFLHHTCFFQEWPKLSMNLISRTLRRYNWKWMDHNVCVVYGQVHLFKALHFVKNK